MACHVDEYWIGLGVPGELNGEGGLLRATRKKDRAGIGDQLGGKFFEYIEVVLRGERQDALIGG